MVRARFFYGWVMLAIAIAGQIATSPGQTYGISVFNQHFRDDLQLSHTAVAGAYMVGTLLAALPVWFVGGLMDRHGIRRPMTGVVLLLGATCIATSQVSGLISLFFAFLMLRMLGQGALSLLSSNTISMWFNARLGTAAGLMSLGGASAFAVIPPVNLYLIDQFGWRATYAFLGLAVWLLMLPLLAFFYRNRPEDIGQVPDRAISKIEFDAAKDAVEKTLGTSMTLEQARRTRSFWILLAMHVVWAMVGTAIIFHVVDLFEGSGLTKADIALFFTLFAASMAGAQLVGGILADNCRLNILLLFSMCGMTFSVMFISHIDSGPSAKIFAVAFGVSQGLFVVVGQTIWARFYGRAHLGRIRGAIWTASIAGSSLGPFLMGIAKDLSGTYAVALTAFAALYAGLALSAIFVTTPRRLPFSG